MSAKAICPYFSRITLKGNGELRLLPHMLSHPSTRHGNGGIRLLLLNSIRLLGLGDRWLMLAIFLN